MEESGRRGRRRKEVNVESQAVTHQDSREATGHQGVRGLIIQREIIRWLAVCLMLLTVLFVVRTTGMIIDYHSDNNQTNCDNLKDQLDTKYNHLTTKYYNLTLEKEQLDTKYNHLTTKYYNLTLEKDQLLSDLNQLKREAAVKSCPSGWKKFGSSCYYGSAERKTWDESRAECQKTGADLVIINSGEEQGFVNGLISNGAPWIGLKRTAGKWTWVDGTPQTTQNWASGYPDNHRDWNCAYHSLWYGWYNVVCSEKRAWLCEKMYLS